MKNKLHLTILLTSCFLFFLSQNSFSQVPDNTTGRLWRLCKVWGFTKYHHPDSCSVDWNGLLMTAIDSVISSTTNESFNDALIAMINAAGPVPYAVDSLVNNNHLNLNSHFEWTEDTLLNQSVRDILDSIEVNFRPKPNCLVKTNDFSDYTYSGWLDFRGDSILNIPSFSYAIESHRLLVFFYYWNIIEYFHPDKALMDQTWDTTLYQFIPLFQQVTNDEEFHLRFLNLVTYINDSHGFTGSDIIINFFGPNYAKLKIDFIENQSVVTKVDAGIPDISTGDIIKKVDGIDIIVLRDSLRKYTPASNESSEERDLHDFNLLAGPAGSVMNLELEDSTGAVYQTSVTRSYSGFSYFNWAFTSSYPVYEITDCGYGYVNMGKLLQTQIDDMYDSLKNTPAIIFDIRNYPNGTLWFLLPYLIPSPKTWALLTIPDPDFPGWYTWYDNQYDAGIFSNPEPYEGKVIILCNAETQSQAEYTVMGLQQCANSFTIGSQTAGADGNISYIFLPGDLYTYWTSLGIYYPDTTTAQRVGVNIDSIVTPTISGIRHGIDEVLQVAFDCVTGIENPPVALAFYVYPNPGSDVIYFRADVALVEMLEIEFFSMTGQSIMVKKVRPQGKNTFALNVSELCDGLYIASLRDGSRSIGSAKIQIVH